MFPAKFVYALLFASVATAEVVTQVANSSEDLQAALVNESVTNIQVKGSVSLDPQAWSTVFVGRDLLISGEGSNKTVLDFHSVQEACVVQGNCTLELRDIKLKGFADEHRVVLGNYSRIRAYEQYSWPSIVSLDGATVFHNTTRIESASIYPPGFYAKQLEALGIGSDFELIDGQTFRFLGLHNLTANLTDQILIQKVGEVLIQVKDVEVSNTASVQAALAPSTANSQISGNCKKTLIIGWQTVLIAIGIAAGILAVIAVLVVTKRTWSWRKYDRYSDKQDLASEPKLHPNV